MIMAFCGTLRKSGPSLLGSGYATTTTRRQVATRFLVFVIVITSFGLTEALNRDLKVCKQTKLSAIMSLDTVVYIQFLDGQWEYIRGVTVQPWKEKSLRQLFYLTLKSDSPDYNQIVNDGFTGFLVTSPNFTDIPENVGLLMSANYDHYMVLERVWNDKCAWCYHYRQYQGEISSRFSEFIRSLVGSKYRAMAFVNGHNELIVASKPVNSRYQVKLYKDGLTNPTDITSNYPGEDEAMGIFLHKDKFYFHTRKQTGTYDPAANKFVPSKTGPTCVLGQDTDKEYKPLLCLLELFGCEKRSIENWPEEFPVDETNQLTLILNGIFMAVNLALIGSAIALRLYFKRRQEEEDSSSSSSSSSEKYSRPKKNRK